MLDKRSQVYVLDVISASAIILATAIALLVANQLLVAQHYCSPDAVLAVLLRNEDFYQAVYALDASRLRAILGSYLDTTPYNLTIFDLSGNRLLSIGMEIEGITGVAILTGLMALLGG